MLVISNIIRRLYVHNNLDIPIYLEDIHFLILPDDAVDIYAAVGYDVAEGSDSLIFALNNDLLDVVPINSVSESLSASVSSLDSDWTSSYFSIASVASSSYSVLSSIEINTDVSKRTGQFYIRNVYTGGGSA